MASLKHMMVAAAAILLVAVLLMGLRGAFITEDTPVPAVGAPGGPLRPLSASELTRWKRGRLLFDRDWKLAEGLGAPNFNGDSCRGCHDLPAIGGAGMVDLNVSRFGFDDGGAGPFTNLPGGQVASRLRRVDVGGREEIDLASADVFEQRQPPTVFGAGLIDAIPEAEILANADPMDINGDGIAGIARMVDTGGGAPEVGRFGWKAGMPKLEDFLKDALHGEIGLTMTSTARGFGATTDTDGVADPEISDGDLQDLLFFMQNLAPPQRKGSTNPLVSTGEQLFSSIGCADCHIPTLSSSEGPVNLFSDLLLHNIYGSGFRGMAEPGADVGYYRTAPLWGVSDTAPYLHDGRAETLREAILFHGEEAAAARLDFVSLPFSDQKALLLFLEDL